MHTRLIHPAARSLLFVILLVFSACGKVATDATTPAASTEKSGTALTPPDSSRPVPHVPAPENSAAEIPPRPPAGFAVLELFTSEG